MPEGPDGRAIIIVKKIVGHGGHHGGSWKVAYADFVTSMMCLFLVLWLVNTSSVVTREKIASYFKRPGVFENGSGSPVQIGGAGFVQLSEMQPTEDKRDQEVDYDITKRKRDGGEAIDKTKGHSKREEEQLKVLAKELEERLKIGGVGSREGDKKAKDEKKGAAKNGDAKNAAAENGLGIAGLEKGGLGKEKEVLSTLESSGTPRVEITMDDYGLNLEIMDTSEGSMFPLGSSKLSPEAEKRMTQIGQILAKIPNNIDIEGHTDGLAFKGPSAQTFDNWDLSAQRANAARRGLLTGGIDEKRIARVAGFADTRLKFPSKPGDPSNRRITIKVRYSSEAEATIRDSLGLNYSVGTKPMPVEERPYTGHFVKKEREPNLNGKSVKVDRESEAASSSTNGLKVELSLGDGENARDSRAARPPSGEGRTDEKYLIFGTKRNFFDR